MSDAPFEETDPIRIDTDSHVPRKLFHAAAGSLLPTIYWFELMPRDTTLLVTLVAAALWIGVDVVRLQYRALNRFLVKIYRPLMKSKESHSLTGASYYAFSMAATLLLFSPLVATLALYFIAFGDPAASVVGRKYGSVTLLGGRSLQGTLAFMGVCFCIAYGGFNTSLFFATAGAMSAALAELFTGAIDDNLTVPLAAGFVMTAVT